MDAFAAAEAKTAGAGPRMDLVFSQVGGWATCLGLPGHTRRSVGVARQGQDSHLLLLRPVPWRRLLRALLQLRLDMALGDWEAVRRGVERCKGLVAKGGDWERKNKLKVGGWAGGVISSTGWVGRGGGVTGGSASTSWRLMI